MLWEIVQFSVVAEPDSSKRRVANDLYSEFHVAEKEMASCAAHIASDRCAAAAASTQQR